MANLVLPAGQAAALHDALHDAAAIHVLRHSNEARLLALLAQGLLALRGQTDGCMGELLHRIHPVSMIHCEPDEHVLESARII